MEKGKVNKKAEKKAAPQASRAAMAAAKPEMQAVQPNASGKLPRPSPDAQTRAPPFPLASLFSQKPQSPIPQAKSAFQAPPLAKPAAAPAPKKSMLSNSLVQVFLISLAIYLALFAYAYLSAPPLSLSFSYSEEPLSRNSQVMLRPGDSLTYSISGPNGTATLQYYISTAPGCPIAITENSQGTYCIDHSGAMLGAKEGIAPNGTLGFFGAWMLAVGPGWRWGENITTRVSNMSVQVTQITFQDLGQETALGRSVRKIKITLAEAGASSDLYYWVDEEKRILVKALSPDGSKIELLNYTR